jgi:hypothetical protein
VRLHTALLHDTVGLFHRIDHTDILDVTDFIVFSCFMVQTSLCSEADPSSWSLQHNAENKGDRPDNYSPTTSPAFGILGKPGT